MPKIKKIKRSGKIAKTKVFLDVDPMDATVYCPIDSVKLFEKNPRINTKAAKKLAQLIEKFGQRSPVVVWRKNSTIYKGNTTWKAMKLLGYSHINALFQDFKSEAEAIAYSLSDNKSHEWSEWDEDVLIQLMEAEELEEYKSDIGFDKKDLEDLFPWESDIEVMDSIVEGDPITTAVIKIKCPIERREPILKFLNLKYSKDKEIEIV